jgi:hypothetical protein
MMNYYNYFTEIEEHFVRRRGKHLLISPMDWRLIAEWRETGVPLQVAIRGIDMAVDSFLSKQTRGSAKLNSLCYCHDSVMSEYAGYLEAHVGESRKKSDAEPETTAQPDNSDVQNDSETAEAREYLSAVIVELKDLAAGERLSEFITEGVDRVLERLEEMVRLLQSGTPADMEAVERDLGIADEILVEALITGIPDEKTIQWEKEAKADLKVYRKKLPKEMYRKIHDNYLRNKVHQTFNIREFSLFRL